MNVLLKELAVVEAGVTMGRMPKAMPDVVERPMFQIGHLLSSGGLDVDRVTSVSVPQASGDRLLLRGDVLLCARGSRITAAVYQGAPAGAIAGSQLLVIRLHHGDIMPEYLAWYLNQRPAQRYFLSRMSGTRVAILHKQTVEELPVAVLRLEKQKACIELEALARREQELTGLWREKRRLLVHLVAEKSLNAER